MSRRSPSLALALAATFAVTPMASQALNIVLTNDDGLTTNVHLPGVVIVNHTADEATRQTDKKSEALQMLKGKVTATPMQFGYEAENDDLRRLENELARALNK